jgi:hypothetical protein
VLSCFSEVRHCHAGNGQTGTEISRMHCVYNTCKDNGLVTDAWGSHEVQSIPRCIFRMYWVQTSCKSQYSRQDYIHSSSLAVARCCEASCRGVVRNSRAILLHIMWHFGNNYSYNLPQMNLIVNPFIKRERDRNQYWILLNSNKLHGAEPFLRSRQLRAIQ